MLEQGGDPGRVGDLGPGGSIGDVEGVDGRAFFGADPRERDGYVFASESGEQFVEQAETVRCLNLDKGVGWVGFVFEGNPRRKIKTVPAVARDLAAGAFQK